MTHKQDLYKHKIWPTDISYEEACDILEQTGDSERGRGSTTMQYDIGRLCVLSTLGGNRMWYIDKATGLSIAGALSLREGGLTKKQIGAWRDQTEVSLLRALWQLNA